MRQKYRTTLGATYPVASPPTMGMHEVGAEFTTTARVKEGDVYRRLL